MIFEEDPRDGKPFGAGEPGATVPLGVFKFNNLPGGMLFPPIVDEGGLFEINFTFWIVTILPTYCFGFDLNASAVTTTDD